MKLVIVQTPGPGRFVKTVETPATTDDVYPATTDTLCWHCCHAFETQPIPMPLSYRQDLDAYRVYGTFCSFACMTGYLRDYRQTLPGASNGSIGMTVFDFYRRCTGNSSPSSLTRAPPRCLLNAFGGHMTIDEFRGSNADYVAMPPRCILHEQVYHERLHSKAHHASRSTMIPQVGTTTTQPATEETLRLKRKHQTVEPITTVSKKRTILEQALGIA
jgi:hypothetical protein